MHSIGYSRFVFQAINCIMFAFVNDLCAYSPSKFLPCTSL